MWVPRTCWSPSVPRKVEFALLSGLALGSCSRVLLLVPSDHLCLQITDPSQGPRAERQVGAGGQGRTQEVQEGSEVSADCVPVTEHRRTRRRHLETCNCCDNPVRHGARARRPLNPAIRRLGGFVHFCLALRPQYCLCPPWGLAWGESRPPTLPRLLCTSSSSQNVTVARILSS